MPWHVPTVFHKYQINENDGQIARHFFKQLACKPVSVRFWTL